MRPTIESLRKDYLESVTAYEDLQFAETAPLVLSVIISEAQSSLEAIDQLMSVDPAEQRASIIKFLAERWMRVRETPSCYTAIPYEKITRLCESLARFVAAEGECHYHFLMPGLTSFYDRMGEDLNNCPLDTVIVTDDFTSLIHVSVLKELGQRATCVAQLGLTPAEKERITHHSAISKQLIELYEKIEQLQQAASSQLVEELKNLVTALRAGSAGCHGGTGTVDAAGVEAMNGVTKFFAYWETLSKVEQRTYGNLKGRFSDSKSLNSLLAPLQQFNARCIYEISTDLNDIIFEVGRQQIPSLLRLLQQLQNELTTAPQGSEKYSMLPVGVLSRLLQKRQKFSIDMHNFLILIKTADLEDSKQVFRLHNDVLNFTAEDLESFSLFLKDQPSRVVELCTLLKEPLMKAFLESTTGVSNFVRFFSHHTPETCEAILKSVEGSGITRFSQIELFSSALEGPKQALVYTAWKNQLPRIVLTTHEYTKVLAHMGAPSQRRKVLEVMQDKFLHLEFGASIVQSLWQLDATEYQFLQKTFKDHWAVILKMLDPNDFHPDFKPLSQLPDDKKKALFDFLKPELTPDRWRFVFKKIFLESRAEKVRDFFSEEEIQQMVKSTNFPLFFEEISITDFFAESEAPFLSSPTIFDEFVLQLNDLFAKCEDSLRSDQLGEMLYNFILQPGELRLILELLTFDKRALVLEAFTKKWSHSVLAFVEIFTNLSSDKIWDLLSVYQAKKPFVLGHNALVRMLASINQEKRSEFIERLTVAERHRIGTCSADKLIEVLKQFPAKERLAVLKKLQHPVFNAYSDSEIGRLLSVFSIQEFLSIQTGGPSEAALHIALSNPLSVDRALEVQKFLQNFTRIYAALYGAQHSIFKSESFLQKIKYLSDRDKMMAILLHIMQNPNSRSALVWRLLQGQSSEPLSQQVNLFKEIYIAAFSRSNIFSQSNIMGKRLFNSEQLSAELRNYSLNMTMLQQNAYGRSSQIIRALDSVSGEWSSLMPGSLDENDSVFSILLISSILVAGFVLPIVFLGPLGIIPAMFSPLVGIFISVAIGSIINIFHARNRSENLARLDKVVPLAISEVKRRIEQLTPDQIERVKDRYYACPYKKYNKLITFLTLGLVTHQSKNSAWLLKTFQGQDLKGKQLAAMNFFSLPKNQGSRLYRCLAEAVVTNDDRMALR